ncbi:MAG: transporter [Burkholderiales bacterium]|nr:transporter [Burkholderiales bacterium]
MSRLSAEAPGRGTRRATGIVFAVSPRIPRQGGGFLALALFACVGSARAQQLEPRTYINLPVGMNFLIAGYVHSTGGLSTNPALRLNNAEMTVKTPVVAYARAIDLWGKSAKVDVVVPGGCVSGTADVDGAPASRDVCGLLDPAFRLAVNFHGAPALLLKEFARYRQDLIIGASLQVSAPWGQYDPSRLVNLGTNTWIFRPEAGISKAMGAFSVELSAGASIFTTNHDFFGGRVREQDPMYNFQGHVIYQFPGGTWAAVNGTYYTGGRTTVNGVRGDDRQKASRFGGTLAFPLDRHNSIKVYASSGYSVRAGTDFDILGVAWQYRWGSGL